MNNIEFRKLVRLIIQEEVAAKPDSMAHQELAKMIVTGLNSAHSQEETESVVGGDNVDVQALESGIRNSQYFSIGTVDYQWDQVWKIVSDKLQKDYQQKLRLGYELVEKLKNNPNLGSPEPNPNKLSL